MDYFKYDIRSEKADSYEILQSLMENWEYEIVEFNHPELNLEMVYLIDLVQKGRTEKLTKEAIQLLRKYHLVEGRVNNLFLSADVSKTMDAEAKYIRNKAFDDQYYKDLIVSYLQQYGKAQRKDIKDLIWDKLPDMLTDKQKNSKISTLLTALRRKGVIKTDSKNQQTSCWILS